jgi:hypothetical protein
LKAQDTKLESPDSYVKVKDNDVKMNGAEDDDEDEQVIDMPAIEDDSD